MRKLTAFALFAMLPFFASSLPAQESGETKPRSEAAGSENPAAGNAQENAAADARSAAEQAFTKLLTGATLFGNFTVDADGVVDPARLLKPDRYELATVNKVKDDIWLFIYVHEGVPIPLTMKVLWAGTTPVLTLDEFTIAGMGTFSARLMFHDNRYAGTWQHGDKGGLMFGKIETVESKRQRSAIDPRQVPPPQPAEPQK
jgi:hypothetical protein